MELLKNNKDIFLTIEDINNFEGTFPFSAGRQLLAVKEFDQMFKRNTIKILDVGNTLVGYISDLYFNVLEGTSLMRDIFDLVGDFFVVEVIFVKNSFVKCRIIDYDFKMKKLIDAFTKNVYDDDYPFRDEFLPSGKYPFDVDEFPFEFDLVDFSLGDGFIPDVWCRYFACFWLNIDYEQLSEVEELEEEFDLDFVELIIDLTDKKRKDIETIKNSLLYNHVDSADELAEKIFNILNRKPNYKVE